MARGDRKRFRVTELDLELEAEENERGEWQVTDDAGSIWTETEFRSADGKTADTFGPGRKGRKLPTIVRHLRALKRLT